VGESWSEAGQGKNVRHYMKNNPQKVVQVVEHLKSSTNEALGSNSDTARKEKNVSITIFYL
jgi:hypothetical protein